MEFLKKMEEYYERLAKNGYKRTKEAVLDEQIRSAQEEEALREREIWDEKTGEFLGYKK